MSKPISQREARRLRKRVEQMERAQHVLMQGWMAEYPGGYHIDTVAPAPTEYAAFRTARKLGFLLVAVPDGGGKMNIFAVKP